MNRGGMIKKKILITSGAHPIALSLTEELLRLGHQVTLMGQFEEGNQSTKHLLEYPGFTRLVHDVACSLYLDMDEVYDLSSQYCEEKQGPILGMRQVVFGTYNLLCLAKRSRAKLLHLTEYVDFSSADGMHEAKRLAQRFCAAFEEEGLWVKILDLLPEQAEMIAAQISTCRLLRQKESLESASFFIHFARKLIRSMESSLPHKKTAFLKDLVPS